PVAMGVSAFGVLVTLSLPSLPSTSQAQPEPNCVSAAFLNCSLNCSTPPKSSLSLASSVPGTPPPVGDNEFQKKLWFQCWPALLNTGVRSGLPCESLTTSSRVFPLSASFFSTRVLSVL